MRQNATTGNNSNINQTQIDKQININIELLEKSFTSTLANSEISRKVFMDLINKEVSNGIDQIHEKDDRLSEHPFALYILGVLSGTVSTALLMLMSDGYLENSSANHYEVIGNVISLSLIGNNSKALFILNEEIKNSPNALDLVLLRSEINLRLGNNKEMLQDLLTVAIESKNDDVIDNMIETTNQRRSSIDSLDIDSLDIDSLDIDDFDAEVDPTDYL